MEAFILDILESISGTDEVRIDKDMDLFESGFIDSLGVIQFLLEVEQKLGIELAPTEVTREDIATVNKIVDYITMRKLYAANS